MLPGRRYTPADIWELALRFKWLIVLPWIVVGVGAFMYARTLENRYKADSLLQVVAQKVPQNLVRSTVTTSIEERLPMITQNILSRTRLERIIQDFGLYAKERRAGRLMEDVVNDMRTAHIKVAAVKGDAFRVSFESTEPRQALRVTERLASLFVEENLRDREMQAENTNQFLDSQLDEARRRLLDSEKKLEEYSRQYRGELPSQIQTNLQQLQTLDNRLTQNAEALLRDRDRRATLEKDLAEAVAEVEASQQMASAEAGGTEALQPAAVQLAQLKARIAQASLRLRPEHPDMLTMNRALRDLEAQAEAESLATPLSGTPRARNPLEAQKIKRVQELRAEIQQIDRQLVERQAQAKQMQRSIAETERRVDATPTRESEMIAITRDYQTLEKIYTSLLAKSEDAKVASNLERRQIGEQFKVIDAARLPERPFSPDRTAYYFGGVGGGLMLGLGLVGLLEFRDSSFRTDSDVVGLLGLPVLAIIPAIVTREDRRYRRKKRMVMMAASAAVGVIALGGVAAWRLGLLQRIF